MNILFTAGNFLKYRLHADNAQGIHSPFVFELFNDVINDKTPFYGYKNIESLRARYLLDDRKINIQDYGTGKKNRQERISDIARKSLMQPKYAELIFRIINKFNPENILEIGTSLGITTLYISLPNRQNKVITLEGCPETASLAQKNFDRLKQINIEIIPGEFEISLPQALDKFNRLDFVLFDGNHRKNPTLSYFNRCLKLANENSVFVFDDIHWSREMELAWKEIKENKEVTLTIDLFQIGLVFFRKGMEKQDFVLRY